MIMYRISLICCWDKSLRLALQGAHVLKFSQVPQSLIKGLLFCSQFGDQLVADLGELLDLLILLKDSSF